VPEGEQRRRQPDVETRQFLGIVRRRLAGEGDLRRQRLREVVVEIVRGREPVFGRLLQDVHNGDRLRQVRLARPERLVRALFVKPAHVLPDVGGHARRRAVEHLPDRAYHLLLWRRARRRGAGAGARRQRTQDRADCEESSS